ncbi:MAG: RagB/SusD family nutrient uptake outer membrane protein [Paludibacteraceae bacterium]|nr:RagB/SusD family nutrient uptake outer membrane protein [Paludibacteraceae bacterium]
MKNSFVYKLYIVLLSVVLGLTSCLNEFLEPEPMNLITHDNYWQSESDARAGLNAAYAHLQQTYKVGFTYWLEARGDNFIASNTGTYPYQGVCYNNPTSSYPCCNWNNWYKIVSVANYGIHFIPGMTGKLSETKQHHLLSEAYFLRAYAYFNMVRIWGDVPLVTKPTLTLSDVYKPYRTGKDTVMQQVIADLDSAALYVDESVEELYLYSAGALYALATDVAMWNHDYLRALDFSERLMTLNRYSLETADFAKVCCEANTPDNIWTMAWNYSANGDNSIVITYNNSANLLIPTKRIYEKWTDWETQAGCADLRRIATIDSARVSQYGASHCKRHPTALVRTWKWSPGEFLNQTDYREMPIPLYRFADILLLRAEALNQTGDMAGAVDLMNRVRRRAGLPDRSVAEFADIDELEDALLQERQFELFAEGKRWFDLVRTGRAMTVMNEHFENYIKAYKGEGYTLFTEDWQLLWPVHRDIINENENITQTGNY